MTLHYLSHPFTGDEEKNRAVAEAIQRELQEKHPRVIYVNPLANFKALAGMPYGKILDYCLALLMRCDSVTMAGNYRAQKHEYVEEI